MDHVSRSVTIIHFWFRCIYLIPSSFSLDILEFVQRDLFYNYQLLFLDLPAAQEHFPGQRAGEREVD